MTAGLVFDNLVSWSIQVAVIATIGALLPALLRVRHPKSQLVYYHGILALCLALPLIQTWQQPLVVVSEFPMNPSRVVQGSSLSWTTVVLSIALLGVAARLCWLGVGLLQLRRYRKSALPLYPSPPSVHLARKQTGADAQFCVSTDVDGPATLGWFNPVILLPPSFLELNADAQLSIASHELLHVRRCDWLITLMEELAGALLWFHPAVWWMLGKTRLMREQLVDAEVVQMSAPGPYIEALLSMAVVSSGNVALPAASFFTEGHLVDRMRMLVSKPRRSVSRLFVSYTSAACCLAFAGWAVLVLFPLSGQAQIVTTSPGLRVYQPMEGISVRRAAIEATAKQAKFNLRVPHPGQKVDNLFYVVDVGLTDEGVREGRPFTMSFPPPPPPPGPLFSAGVRVLRAGAVASPEDIGMFIASFPDRSLVQVIQGEDGTVQRVMVQARRSADETSFTSTGPGVVFGFVGTQPAEFTNGID